MHVTRLVSRSLDARNFVRCIETLNSLRIYAQRICFFNGEGKKHGIFAMKLNKNNDNTDDDDVDRKKQKKETVEMHIRIHKTARTSVSTFVNVFFSASSIEFFRQNDWQKIT